MSTFVGDVSLANVGSPKSGSQWTDKFGLRLKICADEFAQITAKGIIRIVTFETLRQNSGKEAGLAESRESGKGSEYKQLFDIRNTVPFPGKIRPTGYQI
jgi:hypothetical protein